MSTDTNSGTSTEGDQAEASASETSNVSTEATARAAGPSQPPPMPANDASSQTSGAPSASVPPASGVDAKLAEAVAESARLRDQLLRTAADFDNFRKRARREQTAAERAGRESLLKDLLPVFDNLERAAAHAADAPDAKAVSDGLRIVLKQFTDTLEKSSIKRVVTIGHPFDPTVHEAIQHLPSKDHPAGVVLAEVQPGYMLGEHLLRAALVVVSKGAPTDAAAN